MEPVNWMIRNENTFGNLVNHISKVLWRSTSSHYNDNSFTEMVLHELYWSFWNKAP